MFRSFWTTFRSSGAYERNVAGRSINIASLRDWLFTRLTLWRTCVDRRDLRSRQSAAEDLNLVDVAREKEVHA